MSEQLFGVRVSMSRRSVLPSDRTARLGGQSMVVEETVGGKLHRMVFDAASWNSLPEDLQEHLLEEDIQASVLLAFLLTSDFLRGREVVYSGDHSFIAFLEKTK